MTPSSAAPFIKASTRRGGGWLWVGLAFGKDPWPPSSGSRPKRKHGHFARVTTGFPSYNKFGSSVASVYAAPPGCVPFGNDLMAACNTMPLQWSRVEPSVTSSCHIKYYCLKTNCNNQAPESFNAKRRTISLVFFVDHRHGN